MDVDDDFLLARGNAAMFRRRGCRCAEVPVAPESGSGCRCPRCGAACVKCPGFGFVEHPVRRFHRILASVKSQIRRRYRQLGHDPGFVRLPLREIKVVIDKLKAEGEEHWTIRERWVDPGPPLRILDVFVVEDLRRG